METKPDRLISAMQEHSFGQDGLPANSTLVLEQRWLSFNQGSLAGPSRNGRTKWAVQAGRWIKAGIGGTRKTLTCCLNAGVEP
jgi:hypothetical protein